MAVDRDEITNIFATFTLIIFFVAILVGIIIFCCSKCLHRQTIQMTRRLTSRRSKAGSVDKNRLFYTTNHGAITVDCSDLDYIDEKNIELIASTVQITSLHNSPMVIKPVGRTKSQTSNE